jgi:hypothetical protein
MRKTIAGIIATALLIAFSAPSTAESGRKKRRSYDSYSYAYPYATPRQIQNERAYQRGEYYERDSNALIPGSRAWFEQKERESGGGTWR